MNLLDNLIKSLGTVLACKNEIGHKEVPNAMKPDTWPASDFIPRGVVFAVR